MKKIISLAFLLLFGVAVAVHPGSVQDQKAVATRVPSASDLELAHLYTMRGDVFAGFETRESLTLAIADYTSAVTIVAGEPYALRRRAECNDSIARVKDNGNKLAALHDLTLAIDKLNARVR